jgi:AraC-like DNA-binding protein
MTLREHLRAQGKARILDALARHKSVKGAARELGINRTHLYRVCDRFGVRLPRERRLAKIRADKSRFSLLWMHGSKRAGKSA